MCLPSFTKVLKYVHFVQLFLLLIVIVMLMIVMCQPFLIPLINWLAKVEVCVEPERFSLLGKDLDRIRIPSYNFTSTMLSKPKQITQIHLNDTINGFTSIFLTYQVGIYIVLSLGILL